MNSLLRACEQRGLDMKMEPTPAVIIETLSDGRVRRRHPDMPLLDVHLDNADNGDDSSDGAATAITSTEKAGGVILSRIIQQK
jgi:hypothetical protein